MSTIVTSEGSSGVLAAKKYGFEFASTNIEDALVDEVKSLVIATKHNLHGKQIIQGLKAKKNIFTEKPMALTKHEISDIVDYYQEMKINPFLWLALIEGFLLIL